MANFLPEISYEVIVRNVTLSSTYTYTCEAPYVNPNDYGVGETIIAGDYLIDFAGYVFEITGVSGSVLTVYDVNEIDNGNGPYVNKPGFIYRAKNSALILTQAQLRRLDQSAADLIQPIEKGIIWSYRGVQIDDGATETDNVTRINLGTNLAYTVNTTGWQGGNEVTIDASGSGGTSPLTTKGDLYTYSTTDTRLPVGTDGYILSADSSESTGLKWVANTGSSGTVTSISAGNGLDFTTITTSGSITLGTPSTINNSSTNSVTATSHTHAFTPAGSNHEIQFNNSGVLGSDSDFVFDDNNANLLASSGITMSSTPVYSTALGGNNHTFSGAVVNSAFIGGAGHTIDGADNTVIIGGGGANSVTTGVDNAVYVPTLYIFDTPDTDTGTLNSLVWDNTTGEVKQRAITGGSGSPGGSNTEIQFNDSGSFNGEYSFKIFKANHACNIASDLRDSSATIGGFSSIISSIGDGTTDPSAEAYASSLLSTIGCQVSGQYSSIISGINIELNSPRSFIVASEDSSSSNSSSWYTFIATSDNCSINSSYGDKMSIIGSNDTTIIDTSSIGSTNSVILGLDSVSIVDIPYTTFMENACIQSDRYFYLGMPDVDGSWRIGQSGDNLIFQQRESSTWNTKSTISGA